MSLHCRRAGDGTDDAVAGDGDGDESTGEALTQSIFKDAAETMLFLWP